jgi:hypothetical protein
MSDAAAMNSMLQTMVNVRLDDRCAFSKTIADKYRTTDIQNDAIEDNCKSKHCFTEPAKPSESTRQKQIQIATPAVCFASKMSVIEKKELK